MKLLAPNGKPSNLTPEQYRLVRTPAFKAWFGDWENSPETASKVVDENGEPLVVYHGAKIDFNEFIGGKLGVRKDNSQGFYFTPFKNIAVNFATNGFVKEVFLKIFNLKIAKSYLEIGTINKDYVTNAIDKGYDGAYFMPNKESLKNGYYSYYNEEYVAFYPEQIKLADGTNTTFDGSNPDIRYKNGGIITEKAEILYHGTSLNRANKILKDGFDLERQSDKTKQGHKKAISFTSSYQEAKEHSDWAAEKFNDKPAIISINIPFEILSGKSFFDMDMDMEKAYKLFELKKIDGISFCDYETGDGCEEMEVAIFNIEKLNQNKLNFTIEYSLGGELTLTSEQVENKLGRKLHWWNDDVVTINGANYKKVFLKPEYKIK